MEERAEVRWGKGQKTAVGFAAGNRCINTAVAAIEVVAAAAILGDLISTEEKTQLSLSLSCDFEEDGPFLLQRFLEQNSSYPQYVSGSMLKSYQWLTRGGIGLSDWSVLYLEFNQSSLFSLLISISLFKISKKIEVFVIRISTL